MDPLELLKRKDKWFLGGGKGAIYAPPFPKALTAPGFWDECYLADIRIPRLFTVLMLDSRSRPVRFDSKVEDWRPDRLVLKHTAPGVVIREVRCVTEANAWASRFEVLVSSGPLHFFQWALFEVREQGFGSPWTSMRDAEVLDGSIAIRFDTAWPAELEPDRTAVEAEHLSGGSSMLPAMPIYLEMGGSVPRHSWTVNLTQRHDESPQYELSVLPQKFRNGALPRELKLPADSEGLVHLVQHFVVEPGEDVTLACGSGLSPSDASQSLNDALAAQVVERSAEAWRRYFASVPQFSSSDPWLTAAYWYRWYGLRLNTVDLPGLPMQGSGGSFGPYVTEGIGFFRNFITYSAQAHLREVTWMHDLSLALGILKNLEACQREDGSFPGHNYAARPARDFYHADFAPGAAQLTALHGVDVNVVALRRYADYLVAVRGLAGLGTLIFDQNETGQEYMSRYQWVSESADRWEELRLVGVEATAYTYSVLRYLGDPRAEEYKGYLLAMWDEESAYFCDRRPSDGALSPERPATGLYPLMFLSGDFTETVEKWLANPHEFDLEKGFPATAASDTTFSAEGEWKGKRLNCPWNGRSWPMANSHLVDAIAHAANRNPELRAQAAAALTKTVRLLFHDGDPARPNCYEHYDPVTGVPALYRGYDDYMHSWVVDLILRHAVGVVPGEDHVDPLPLDADWIECSDIPHPRGRMRVRIDRGRAPDVQIVP